MFNLEIKRISLRSVVLSIYPFVVFIFVLLAALLSMGDFVEPEAGLFTIATQVLLYSLINTAVVVFYTLLAGFVYNLLSSFGMKGLRLSLAETETNTEEEQPEQTEQAALTQEETENK